MILVRSPLRISLVGGGSDVPAHYEDHGGAVVSMAINKYIYITTKEGAALFPHKYRLVYSKVEECIQASEIKHPIIKQLLLDYTKQSLDLDVMSDIPAGTGMGSSSAFTIGLHLALGSRYVKRSKETLAQRACHTELVDLKEPIGKQDQYSAAYGGINYFHFSRHKVKRTEICLSNDQEKDLLATLHLVYIGGSRKASALLTEQITANNIAILDQMRILAQGLARDIEDGIDCVGHYVKENWELKKRLSPNVSNEYIDSIISTAIINGATGGKLLGAGGTGFVLLVCPKERVNEMMLSLITRFPELYKNYTTFKIDHEGAKVLYED